MKEKLYLTNTTPKAYKHVDWTPKTLSIINTSKFVCYVRIGGADIPNSVNFDAAIAPFSSYVADPDRAQDFAFSVDNSLDTASLFNLPVLVTFSTGNADVQGPLSSSLVAPASQAYIAKLLGVQNASLIDIWPTYDQAPTSTIADLISGLRNGQYTVVPNLQGDIGPDQSNKVAVWDGATQSGNLLTASLQSVWNWPEVSILCWVKLSAGQWSSATQYGFFQFFKDGLNEVSLWKSSANNFQWSYKGTGHGVALTSPSGWIPFVITLSTANNRGRIYVSGTQSGADVAIGAAAAGTLVQARLAALNVPSLFSAGSLFLAVWTKELTAAEVATISVAP